MPFDPKKADEPLYLPTIALAAAGPLFVLVHTDQAPSDEDFQQYLEAVEANKSRAILIVTPGPGPSPKQREMNRDFVANKTTLKNIKISVVTTNKAVRAIVTIMSWVMKAMDAFPPSQLAEATARLGCPPADAANAQRLARLMQKELLERKLLRPVSAFLVR